MTAIFPILSGVQAGAKLCHTRSMAIPHSGSKPKFRKYWADCERSHHQTLYRLALHDMRFDDLVDIRVIDKGVPDSLRVNYHQRTF